MLWFSSRGILASTYDNKKREKKGPDMGRLVTSSDAAAEDGTTRKDRLAKTPQAQGGADLIRVKR